MMTATRLFLRRRALRPLEQYAATLSTAAGHAALDSGSGEGKKKRWVELPPFAPLDANAAARAISRGDGEGPCSNATAIRWVRRCCPHLPASLVHKLFRQRKVKKNFVTADTCSTDASAEHVQLRKVLAKDELVRGDILFLPLNTQKTSVSEKTNKFGNRNERDFLHSLEIYKDKDIIVINKPSGMAVQGGVGIKNSIDVLAPMFEENSSETPRLVHRLDRDCSGVLVLGRTQLSTSIMHAIFREKTADALSDGTQQVLQRKYVALVLGAPRHPRGLLSAPLAKVWYTWLELFPRTGRKHQLRIHCAEVLGTPIVGDYKYGRQAHQDWNPLPMPETIDEEMLKRRKLPFGLSVGGGSIAEQQPQLHLHCKQMILPDISAAVQQLHSSYPDCDFSGLEKLSFVAPLPLHMRLSWDILKSVRK
ncbi:hypothetical protein PR202_gb29447 [Eleusine coracana subsp. coracana]|uniref:Pseudouridine synthase RsuA/RluA-like domain-containing protein n=1 Tax=Eleusine coracana subsp. coracana TaxID=191504 RepID=A0AAV5FX27_ELECO|nr:hypothetical protein PR202_gb29447 [Eleusine coracana subsp. coracana]